MKLPRMPWPAELAVRIGGTLLVPVVVVGLSVIGASAVTALPADAAFRVDHRVVTKHDFDRRVHTLEALYGVVPPKDASKLGEFRRDSAQAIVLSMVLEDAAAEKGIAVPEKVARDILTNKIQQDFQGGRDAFADFLGQVGASEQDVIDAIKLQQSVGLLFRGVVSASPDQVTDDDVRRFYDGHKVQLVQPETRRIRNIVTATDTDAGRVIDRARTGADFAVLAKQLSIDESTRNSGGDLGFVARVQLDGTYGDAAFGAAPGTVFGPVKTGVGWNVGQVLEIKPGALPPLEQIEQQLRTEMVRQRAMDMWNAWVEQRVKAADIQYTDEYRPTAEPSLAAMPGPGGLPPAAGSGGPSPAGQVPAPAGGAR